MLDAISAGRASSSDDSEAEEAVAADLFDAIDSDGGLGMEKTEGVEDQCARRLGGDGGEGV
jgi:hypothetical protein